MKKTLVVLLFSFLLTGCYSFCWEEADRCQYVQDHPTLFHTYWALCSILAFLYLCCVLWWMSAGDDFSYSKRKAAVIVFDDHKIEDCKVVDLEPKISAPIDVDDAFFPVMVSLFFIGLLLVLTVLWFSYVETSSQNWIVCLLAWGFACYYFFGTLGKYKSIVMKSVYSLQITLSSVWLFDLLLWIIGGKGKISDGVIFLSALIAIVVWGFLIYKVWKK